MNSFEIAILRILIKRNHQPIAIHSLIEGFPDGSEKQVIDAISNLENFEFITVFSGFPIEEKYVAYNQEKKQEILKVIDPLYNDINDNRHNFSRHTYDGIVPGNRNSNKNKSYVFSLRQSRIKPINITIAIICVIFTGFILTSVPETNEIEHFYNLSDKYSKFKEGDSQVYANDDKKHWKVKFMNPDIKNYFVKHEFDKTDNNLSREDALKCQNA